MHLKTELKKRPQGKPIAGGSAYEMGAPRSPYEFWSDLEGLKYEF
jgi:hypothetical protein